MTCYPSFEEFRALARTAGIVPVSRSLLFDTWTAVTAYARLARPPFGFLLESVVGGETWARYTYLGTEPREAWRVTGNRVDRWTREGGWEVRGTVDDPLADFEIDLLRSAPAEVPGLPRFWGGWVGFFGYDMVRRIEHLPDAPPRALEVPDALFMRTGAVVAIDNLFGMARVIVPVETTGADEAELRRLYDEAAEEIAALEARLHEGPGPVPLHVGPPPAEDPPFESSCTREEFENGVRRIQEYIRAGDAFQVVLSQRLSMPLGADPFDLYRVLRSLNPSPYLYYLDLDGMQLVGSSPEVLVRLEDGRVIVRPIAGTLPRGKTPQEDVHNGEALLADPKEAAEHVMLVDLARNDLGRVASPGTVRVEPYRAIERYSHVMHIVSGVEGELAPQFDAFDLFAASFPAGTLVGAPKVRAMEIIDDLEESGRGLYAGTAGYYGTGGDMDQAITIRTLVFNGDEYTFQAGAGIVADSVPEKEYQEVLAKGAILKSALEMAGEGL